MWSFLTNDVLVASPSFFLNLLSIPQRGRGIVDVPHVQRSFWLTLPEKLLCTRTYTVPIPACGLLDRER